VPAKLVFSSWHQVCSISACKGGINSSGRKVALDYAVAELVKEPVVTGVAEWRGDNGAVRKGEKGGVFIHFDTDSCGECDSCGSQGTIMHLLLTRTNGSLHLCETCFAALALAFRLAAGKLRLHDPMAFASIDRE
jgi:hypothetical protein